MSCSARVLDATYFVIAFMRSANGSPARSGHAAAMASQVRRPNSSASLRCMISSIAGITGTAALEGGTKQITELELKCGKYAFVCFISDRKGGRPHIAKGQIVEVSVE